MTLLNEKSKILIDNREKDNRIPNILKNKKDSYTI